MRPLLLVAVAACSGPSARPAAPASHRAEPTPTVVAPVSTIAPVSHAAPAPNAACTLRWDEVERPERIVLTATLDEECTTTVDPDLPTPDITTETGRMRGVPVELTLDGPNGSGRFISYGLAVGTGKRTRYACVLGSTVGWRLMYPVGKQLAPLPFLSDLDHDGSAELVLWDRLPWGDSEVDNALLPIVYVLDGDALVRRDDLAKPIYARLAAAYRARAQITEQGDPTACFLAVAQFFES